MVIVLALMVIAPESRIFSADVRNDITWILTLFPLILYCLLEVSVWRGNPKRKWIATASAIDEVNSSNEESPPAEVISSPVHQQNDDNGDEDEDEGEDDDGVEDVEIELPEIKTRAVSARSVGSGSSQKNVTGPQRKELALKKNKLTNI